jgi:hypothetical protein
VNSDLQNPTLTEFSCLEAFEALEDHYTHPSLSSIPYEAAKSKRKLKAGFLQSIMVHSDEVHHPDEDATDALLHCSTGLTGRRLQRRNNPILSCWSRSL